MDCFSQDTIYCDAYPKGIVVGELTDKELHRKRFEILKNDARIWFDKDEVIKVVGKNGLKYENKEYSPSGKLVVDTDKESGKVYYSEVVEVKGASKKELYNALMGLPNTDVYYNMLSKDDNEYTSIIYRPYTYVKFAGDLYTLFCTLTIRIKDEKIKYEMTDYRMFFSEKQNINALGNSNYNTGATNVSNFPIENYYNPNSRSLKHNIWEGYLKIFDKTKEQIKVKLSKAKQGDW